MSLNCFSLSLLLGDEQLGRWRCTLRNLSSRRNPPHEKQVCWLCLEVNILPAWLHHFNKQSIRSRCQPVVTLHAAGTEWSQWIQEVKDFIARRGFQLPEAFLACLLKVSQLWSLDAASLKPKKEKEKKCMKVVQPHGNGSKLSYFPFHVNWKGTVL